MNVPGITMHPASEQLLEQFLASPTHAILLAGAQGSGKTHIANSLATQLLGTDTLKNEAYFRRVTPQKGTITIEQIRELINFFRLKVPGQAAIKRAAILQDADAMGLEAQNALLKQLEEPPADSILILTSSRPERLLPTIRSRVQLLTLANPTTESLEIHFKAAGYSDAAVRAALLRSGSNIAEAERLLQDGGADDTTVSIVKQLLAGSTYDRLLLVDRLAKQKDELGELIDTLATVADASLQAAASKGAATVERWKQVLQAAHEAQDSLDRSGNAKLILTELMLSL